MIHIMNFDVVIVGGGLVGASLAASLKDSGLLLALLESRASLKHASVPKDDNDWDSRIYAISPGSRDFIQKSGAWDLLDSKRIAPVEEMRVFGDTGSELDFSAYQMGVPELACILENRALQQALWQVLERQENLTILNSVSCSSLITGAEGATENASVALEDGRSIQAKLIVGADGRDSWVRNQVNISAAPVDYKQCGVVANFTTELPHRGIAHQWFQEEGILALLPLPGNRVSMVWSVSTEQSAELLALTHQSLSEKVAEAAFNTLGKMQVITSPAAFPLRLLVLPKITSTRVALIGDAAHNMHPLAGQGVNTGFRDAQQLSEVLIDRGVQGDSGDAFLLRRYERKRKEDIYTMQATTYGLKYLFNNDISPFRSLRNVGMDVTNRIIPLKKLLMRHALT